MTRSGCAKDRQCGRDAMKHAPDVDIDHAVPFIDLQLVKQRKRHQARIADENIELTEPVLRPLDERGNVVAPGDVKLQRFGLAARLLELCGDRLQPVIPSRAQHHLGALRSEVTRSSFTDSAARSGDRDDLTLYSGHDLIPLAARYIDGSIVTHWRYWETPRGGPFEPACPACSTTSGSRPGSSSARSRRRSPAPASRWRPKLQQE